MTDSHIGKTCPYCQFPLKADAEVVYCPACKVSHHRECWEQNGKCTTFGCRETIYQSMTKDRLEISFDEPSSREPAPALAGSVNKMLAVALILSLLVIIGLIAGYAEFFNIRRAEPVDPAAPVSPGSVSDPGGVAVVPPQTYAPSVIAALNADYYIDYEHGTIPISDLPIGVRVVDPSWEWEYRLGVNYSNNLDGEPMPQGEVKPVTWIVVARDHYDLGEGHVTLISEDLIGLFAFDDSTNRDHVGAEWGYNHWGESGTFNAHHGLRPWLNSTGLHSGEGFYRAFSADFKRAVLTTTVPNKEVAWINGNAYSTSDHVFVPSSTELNDQAHDWDYRIGNVYSYFAGAGDEERIALMVGNGSYEVVEKLHGGDLPMYGNNWHYWLRSPSGGCNALIVAYDGRFSITSGAYVGGYGVRPVLNLKSDILVSEIMY